jgi:hypothetical protein
VYGCGRKVILVEAREAGLGGLLRRKPRVTVQQADFVPSPGRGDRVDDLGNRDPE